MRRFWCRWFHSRISYAGGNSYYCQRCGLSFLVGWAKGEAR